MANDITIPLASHAPVAGLPAGSVLDASWYRSLTTLADQHNKNVRDVTVAKANIATNTTNIATNTSNIASNTSAIAALQVAPAFAHAEYNTNTTISGTIPYDDTIPQISEGTQILSLSITPTKANSLITVRFQGQGGVATAGPLTAALFVNGGSDAVQVAVIQTAATNTEYDASLQYTYAPGSTSAQTIAIRVGGTSGNSFMNGVGIGTRRYGGAQAATLVAQEILQ